MDVDCIGKLHSQLQKDASQWPSECNIRLIVPSTFYGVQNPILSIPASYFPGTPRYPSTSPFSHIEFPIDLSTLMALNLESVTFRMDFDLARVPVSRKAFVVRHGIQVIHSSEGNHSKMDLRTQFIGGDWGSYGKMDLKDLIRIASMSVAEASKQPRAQRFVYEIKNVPSPHVDKYAFSIPLPRRWELWEIFPPYLPSSQEGTRRIPEQPVMIVWVRMTDDAAATRNLGVEEAP